MTLRLNRGPEPDPGRIRSRTAIVFVGKCPWSKTRTSRSRSVKSPLGSSVSPASLPRSADLVSSPRHVSTACGRWSPQVCSFFCSPSCPSWFRRSRFPPKRQGAFQRLPSPLALPSCSYGSGAACAPVYEAGLRTQKFTNSMSFLFGIAILALVADAFLLCHVGHLPQVREGSKPDRPRQRASRQCDPRRPCCAVASVQDCAPMAVRRSPATRDAVRYAALSFREAVMYASGHSSFGLCEGGPLAVEAARLPASPGASGANRSTLPAACLIAETDDVA